MERNGLIPPSRGSITSLWWPTGTAVDASETFKIAGGSNITTSVSGDTLTITGASTPPAGSDREIQFNNGGSFGSDSNFVYTDPIGSGDLRLGVGISTPANLYATGPAAMQNTVLHLHNPTTGNVGAGVKMTRSNTGTTDADGFEYFDQTLMKDTYTIMKMKIYI